MQAPNTSTRRCDTVLKAILMKRPILLDVRTHTEFVGFHLPTARNITPSEIPSYIKEIKNWNKPVVVYSSHGLRSGLVCQLLKRAGVEVYDACSQSRVAALLNKA